MTHDLYAIARALAAYKDAFDAVSYEHPGVINIEADGALWAIGTVNGPLEADYYETEAHFLDGHAPDRSVTIAVSDTASADEAAAAILAAMSTDGER